MRRKSWHVKADPPPPYASNSDAAVQYLSTYVMGSALHDERIITMDADSVTIRAKDYRTNEIHALKLSGDEFVERFCFHILPTRYVRVRHYGLHSGRCRKRSLEIAKVRMEGKPIPELGVDDQSSNHSPDDIDRWIAEMDAEPDEAPVGQKRQCPYCRQQMTHEGNCSPFETYIRQKEDQAVRAQVRTVIDIDASIDLPRLTKLAAGAADKDQTSSPIEEISESHSVTSDGSVTISILDYSILDYSILDYSLMVMDWLMTLVLTTASRCDAWNVSLRCYECKVLPTCRESLWGEEITEIDAAMGFEVPSSDSHYAIALVSIPVPDT